MFIIYHSNQLDVLQKITSTLIAKDPLLNPMQEEVILVKSLGMAQWLQIQLAEQFGISANINCPLPSTFIWKMFAQVLPNVPKASPFNNSHAMRWKLMSLLQDSISLPAFAPLQYYLADDNNKRKIHQLADRVANLFKQYIVYRPHWLECWQHGGRIDGLTSDQNWQAPLWACLVEHMRKLGQLKWHSSNLYKTFINTLEHAKCCPPGLPQRIFIFGITAMPSWYIDVLHAMSHHIKIYLMLTNPCRHYLRDVQDYTPITHLQSNKHNHYYQTREHKRLHKATQEAPLFNNSRQQQNSNPLLDSWGALGRNHLYLLSQLQGVKEVDAFVDIANNNMLHAIQRDILEHENRTVLGITSETLEDSIAKRYLDPEDRSISFHMCHSPQREVEVLHDQLLNMLEKDRRLTPRDIIVMAASIDSYTPYIQSIFGNTTDACCLPFTISDHTIYQPHPILQAFILLLELPQSRFTSKEILNLLEVPALAARFSIGEEDLQLLRHWVEESGVRWGLNDDNVRELDLPVTGQHTWSFGVTRMLLGYAMDSNVGDWNGVLPYDESRGLAAKLAGRLADFLSLLSYWSSRLKESKSLEEWLPLCNQLLDTFFLHDSANKEIITQIERYWQEAINFGLSEHYPHLIPLNILQHDLLMHIDKTNASKQFLSGQIIFCTLNPMRSIPFKVICLLGMNDGVYPRTMPVLSFDLMTQQPEYGDCNKRMEDLYLFLETIVSAQDRLYISFIGISIQDNRERFPSALITTLIEYVKHSYYLPGDENLDADRSAQHIEEHLLQQHTRTPYDPENFLPDSEQQSYAAQWLPVADSRCVAPAAFNKPLIYTDNQHISLDTLKRFYRHPIRAFFQLRLGVHFNLENDALPDEENFTVNNLSRYRLNDQILNAMINDEPLKILFQQTYTAGKLPFGAFGKVYWQNQEAEMTILAEKVRAERSIHHRMEVDIKINDTRITGWLNKVQQDGLLRWRPATLSIVDGMSLWLEHLLYCCIGGKGLSRLYGRKNTVWRFAALKPEDARKHLIELITGYQHGLCQPLLLLNKSGWAWLSQCFQLEKQHIDQQEETQDIAHSKLLQTFYGDHNIIGEIEDPYVHRVIPRLNSDYLAQILFETERYLLPIAQHKIT